jgi:hypothetical protein
VGSDTELVQRCLPLVDHVEQLLAGYYGLTPGIRASNFLQLAHVGSNQLGAENLEGHNRRALTSRGYVTALIEDDEVYMAIGLDKAVLTALSDANPMQGLANSNLDALCVLAEEISHFHVLAQAIATQTQVTRLGLEVQGEIDKLLVAALMVHAQTGHPHMLPLARLIFDYAEITDGSYLGYQMAHRLAARTWYEIIGAFGDHPTTLRQPCVRAGLNRVYRQQSHSKVEILSSARWAA